MAISGSSNLFEYPHSVINRSRRKRLRRRNLKASGNQGPTAQCGRTFRPAQITRDVAFAGTGGFLTVTFLEKEVGGEKEFWEMIGKPRKDGEKGQRKHLLRSKH